MNIEKVPSAKEHGLLFAGFNQDYGCFAVGLETGFRIYNSDPFKERMRKDFDDGGIGSLEMLFRTNYLALVGGGKNPKFPPTKIMIWDEIKQKCIVELEFRSEVKAVKLRRDRIVAVLKNKVFVHSFSANPKKLSTFETVDNEKGICALCPSSTNSLLAFPGRKPGHVQIVDIGEAKKSSSIIQAHETDLRCISMNLEGTKIATASVKGTLVRVFDVQNGQLLNELRRGADTSDILSIAFNYDSTRLCVSSDKGTIHVFNLESRNKTSSFSMFGDVVKYFRSEWSFARYHVAEPYCICAFGTGSDKHSIIVVCADGSHYKLTYDPEKEGECHRESYNKFLKMTDDN